MLGALQMCRWRRRSPCWSTQSCRWVCTCRRAWAAAREVGALTASRAQSWEERERLSKLYEEERTKNLSSVTRIQSVMQTMKEENLESLKRIRMLNGEKATLAKVCSVLQCCLCVASRRIFCRHSNGKKRATMRRVRRWRRACNDIRWILMCCARVLKLLHMLRHGAIVACYFVCASHGCLCVTEMVAVRRS